MKEEMWNKAFDTRASVSAQTDSSHYHKDQDKANMKQLREGNGETDNGFKCREENRKRKVVEFNKKWWIADYSHFYY